MVNNNIMRRIDTLEQWNTLSTALQQRRYRAIYAAILLCASGGLSYLVLAHK